VRNHSLRVLPGQSGDPFSVRTDPLQLVHVALVDPRCDRWFVARFCAYDPQYDRAVVPAPPWTAVLCSEPLTPYVLAVSGPGVRS
jgi:hypothetical protein